MSIEMECGCGIRLVVPEDLSGKEVRCPECGAITIVPARRDRPRQPTPMSRVDDHAHVAAAEEDTVTVSVTQHEADPTWLLRTPEGQEFGPVTRDELDTWVGEGRVSHDCEVAEADGDAIQWQPASVAYPMLIEKGNPFAPQPTSLAASDREPHRGVLILTLALAGCFIPVVSVWGAVMGTRDLRRMQSGKMDPTGESLTRAGQIIATVATMVWIAAFVICLLVLLTRTVNAGRF